jgi:fatty acid elongase 3
MDSFLNSTLSMIQDLKYFENLSEYSLAVNHKNWDWSQLFDPVGFEWETGVTPFSELGVVLQSWVLYFSLILGLKAFMKNREPMKLKGLTALHNLFLCVISLGMCISGVIGAIQLVQQDDITALFCNRDRSSAKGIMYWSLYMYYLSKFPELIDTVILVLKKKRVIFLHWYHHSIVILLTWTWMDGKLSFGIFGLFLNTLVHVFMYWYYFAACLGWNVWYKKYITTGQIVQFCTLFVISSFYPSISEKKQCAGNETYYFSVFINGTFLVLFINFYLKTYLTRKTKKVQ